MNEQAASTGASVGDRAVHRALSSEVRARLLRHLEATADGLDVPELAQRLDLHVNTVRGHLTILERAGLARSRPEERDGPGRPRLRWTATGHASPAPVPRYRLLAEVLTTHLAATAPDPAATATDAGHEWGRHLVEAPGPFQSLSTEDGIERLRVMLDEVGFAPEVDPGTAARPRVLLHECPFLEVAQQHPEVVCAMHLGLVRGALERLGVPVAARDLRPFVTPELCVADLEVATA